VNTKNQLKINGIINFCINFRINFCGCKIICL
jgi:hypothetical protein